MTVHKAKKSYRFAIMVVLVAILVSFNNTSFAFASTPAEEEEFNPSDMIMHHVVDAHAWHFVDGHYGTLHLPIIVYSEQKGLEMFSSANFYDDDHNLVPYRGYKLAHGHISMVEDEEAQIYDLSITKTVLMLFINAALMMLVFTAVARGYKKNAGKAPKGIQSLFEPIIIYLRDDVIKPNIGPKYEKFLPYLLSLFFFIWFGNLLGLLPGAANLTGNISVTIVLAVATFLIVNFSGNKQYWGHIFKTPGVPIPLLPIIVPVEIIGIFTKPISLLIRLFVAITAGHIVILSLIGLIFIFQSYTVGIGSTIIVIFINLIELLVATIQAYVFTMFSSLYIGMAIADHDDH